ncbi:hypothetical protein GWI33_020223 [Rhynchophorus ferrugineus]|uniref:Ionotropic receptor n=1 Tax=Rhynchophorus ferrugineus TaxID=354439 RepID=A0A834LZM9_RHYFE|nr:hypothetical protein GWI33_020223 [Rhynchophorus ferrugineus]
MNGYRMNISLFADFSTPQRNGVFLGRDSFLLQTIMDYVNATYEIKVPVDNDRYGEHNETYSSGDVGEIVRDLVHGSFNSRVWMPFYYWPQMYFVRAHVILLIVSTLITYCFCSLSALKYSKTEEEKLIDRKLLSLRWEAIFIICRQCQNLDVLPRNFYMNQLPHYIVDTHSLNRFLSTVKSAAGLQISHYLLIFTGENFLLVFNELKLLKFWKARTPHSCLILDQRYSMQQLETYFKVLHQNYVYNSMITDISMKKMYYMNPFKPGQVESSNNYSKVPNLYLNLNGYKLNISMFADFSTPKNDGKLLGRDYFLLTTIMDHFNATYETKPPLDNNRYGSFNESYTSGSIGEIARGIVHASFNSRWWAPFYYWAEPLYPHGEETIVALVPIKEKPLTSFFKIINLKLIVGLVINSTIMIIYLKIFRLPMSVVDVIMYMELIFIGKSVKLYHTKFFRILFMSLLFALYYLNIQFQSQIISLFSDQSYALPVKNFNDLVNTKYNINIREAVVNYYKSDNSNTFFNDIRSKIVPRNWTDIRDEIIECQQNIYVSKASEANYYLSKQAHATKRRCYDDHIIVFRVLLCYIIRYGSPFYDILNRLNRRLNEAGFHPFWSSWLVHHPERYYVTADRMVSIEDILTITQYYLYTMAFAFVTFIMEIFYKQINTCL